VTCIGADFAGDYATESAKEYEEFLISLIKSKILRKRVEII
jgi:hypothetical protein